MDHSRNSIVDVILKITRKVRNVKVTGLCDVRNVMQALFPMKILSNISRNTASKSTNVILADLVSLQLKNMILTLKITTDLLIIVM